MPCFMSNSKRSCSAGLELIASNIVLMSKANLHVWSCAALSRCLVVGGWLTDNGCDGTDQAYAILWLDGLLVLNRRMRSRGS